MIEVPGEERKNEAGKIFYEIMAGFFTNMMKDKFTALSWLVSTKPDK